MIKIIASRSQTLADSDCSYLLCSIGTAVDCGPLGNPENGEVNVAGTTVGSTATYSCFTGYQLKGVAIRTCKADGWSDTVPTCEREST